MGYFFCSLHFDILQNHLINEEVQANCECYITPRSRTSFSLPSYFHCRKGLGQWQTQYLFEKKNGKNYHLMGKLQPKKKKKSRWNIDDVVSLRSRQDRQKGNSVKCTAWVIKKKKMATLNYLWYRKKILKTDKQFQLPPAGSRTLSFIFQWYEMRERKENSMPVLCLFSSFN